MESPQFKTYHLISHCFIMVFKSVWPGPAGIPEGNTVSFLYNSPYLAAPHSQSQDLFVDALTGESINVGQFRGLVPSVASFFKESLGLTKGSVAIVFGENSMWTALMHWATLWLGSIVSPSNVMYNAEEFSHQVKMVRPKVIFAGGAQLPVAQEALRDSNIDDCRVISYDQLGKEFRKLLAVPSKLRVEPVTTQDHAYYCMSSGTGGLPKVVILAHGNISANISQMLATSVPFHDRTLSTCAVLPLSHILGLNVHLLFAPFIARKSYVLPKYSEEGLIKTVAKYQIGVLYLVPPIILNLSASKILDKYPGFGKHLKYILTAAAPLSKSLVEAFSLRVPNVHVYQLYGLTETAPFTHFGGRDESYNYENIGWLLPGTDARLVSLETSEDIEELGKQGELWVKGPQIMPGYLKNPDATKSTFEGEWFKTGDVVVVDETGQFRIVDRIKELIKSKGHQVAPAELESILLTNENVLDVAVIGVPDSHGSTELPRAFVVIKEGANPYDIISWFNKRVARHKRLWGGIVVLSSIPKSSAGKILRRILRNRKGDKAILENKSNL